MTRTEQERYVRYRLVAALVSGTAFYGVLPVYLPPIVLQYEEVPYFLLGLCISGVAGATLTLIAGRSMLRGLSCTFFCMRSLRTGSQKNRLRCGPLW